jgi:putative Mg2+ transporter-C (MgtC) family protein
MPLGSELLLASGGPEISWADVCLRLVVAGGLGAAIGFEREYREQEAGLRTHMLVAMGSALFTIVSAFGFHDVLAHSGPSVLTRLDPSRVAAQVVSGIGFLGAGAIIRNGFAVRGLTTAASLWLVAAIGMAAGASLYSGAIVATALTLFALWPLRVFGKNFVRQLRPEEGRVIVRLAQGTSVSDFVGELEGVRHFEIDGRTMVLQLDHVDQRFVAQLADRDDVEAVQWRS